MNAIELFPAMRISASGLQAERTRMEVAASNLANAHSTRGAGGGAFRRRQVIFSAVFADNINGEQVPDGVRIDGIRDDPRPLPEEYMPYHPAADKNGMVKVPNISPIEEMLDMITASRAYEANLAALRQSRDMARETISMGRNA